MITSLTIIKFAVVFMFQRIDMMQNMLELEVSEEQVKKGLITRGKVDALRLDDIFCSCAPFKLVILA